jgi:hypothetical protein
VRVRRLLITLWMLVLPLALPVAAFAADASQGDKPEGDDNTILTIFLVSLGIPVLLALLSLIDVARGKHTERHGDH